MLHYMSEQKNRVIYPEQCNTVASVDNSTSCDINLGITVNTLHERVYAMTNITHVIKSNNIPLGIQNKNISKVPLKDKTKNVCTYLVHCAGTV